MTTPAAHAFDHPATHYARAMLHLLQQIDAGHYATPDAAQRCPFAIHARELACNASGESVPGHEMTASHALLVTQLALAKQTNAMKAIAAGCNTTGRKNAAALDACIAQSHRALIVCAATLERVVPQRLESQGLLDGLEALAALNAAGNLYVAPSHQAAFDSALRGMLESAAALAASMQ